MDGSLYALDLTNGRSSGGSTPQVARLESWEFGLSIA